MTQWIKKPEYFDLTSEITEHTPVFPGDPPFMREQISAISPDEQGSFNLYHLHMGNHTGTHIDFPAHVLAEGKTSSDYQLNELIGDGCVIEVPDDISTISSDFVANNPIQKGDFIFFKTKTEKSSKFVHLDISAAEMLVEKGVRIVGIDQMSVDATGAEDLPVHRYLLGHDVLIVEGLKLSGVEAGRGEIIIAPLKIENIDGSPTRVIMRRES